MRRLINVLVLVLMLAAGIVLAAFPKVREAAAQVQCQNNLKQIGLGLINRHDSYGSYPPAAIPNDNLPCGKRLSWLVETIPFMDQLHLGIDRTQAWDAEVNRVPMTIDYEGEDEEHRKPVPLGELKLFRCPANPAVAEPGWPGLNHYVGITGVGKGSAELALGYSGVGFFGCDRSVKREDIKDGTANTMAVIETNWRNGAWTASGFPTVRSLDPSSGRYLERGGPFGSGHRHITNVVFADGSVRSLTDSIRPEVLEALATIAGGEEPKLAGD
jgi:prepilin-type processing-associated H-X9-DG protein